MHYEPINFSLPEIAGLSKDQIDVHLGLYEGYVKHVNLLYTELARVASDDSPYAANELRRRLGFEFNGMRLHELYFAQLEGGAKVVQGDSAFYEAIRKEFGSFDQWLESFRKLSGRGPGWSILNFDVQAKRFHMAWVAEHEIGQLATLPALLVVDHWEHAFMVDYKPAEKGTYIGAYFDALNWSVVEKRFAALS